jgi:predicted naringenin-chalcone synthase
MAIDSIYPARITRVANAMGPGFSSGQVLSQW